MYLSRLLKGNLGVEPPDHNLGSLKTLEGHYLQEGDGIVIVPLVHLSYNGQQVPHSLGFTTWKVELSFIFFNLLSSISSPRSGLRNEDHSAALGGAVVER